MYNFLKFLEALPGYFWTISKLLCISCMSVSQSLISLPIGYFWGSISETSGLGTINMDLLVIIYKNKQSPAMIGSNKLSFD